MEIVTDKEKLKELDGIFLKEKYDNSSIVTDENKIKELDGIFNKAEQQKNEKPNAFAKFTKDFYTDNISGSSKTEFPNMGEVYTINSKGTVKGALKDLALNFGYMNTADQDARLDMLFKSYPGSIVSKDKFQNVMITLPETAVDKNTNRTFYLDKPGISFAGGVDTVGTTLLYVPGAGWVSKNVVGGAAKRYVAQGAAATGVGVGGDVITFGLGNTQGDGLIPIVDEGKALLNFGFGASGEMIAQTIGKITRFNKATNYLEQSVPTNVAQAFGKQTFITNKGVVTEKTIELAKKVGATENTLKNKVALTSFALALDNGLEPNIAKQVAGLNEFGISVWLAAAQGNKKALKELDLIRAGNAGESMQSIVLAQDDVILQEHFKALTKMRDKMLSDKNSAIKTQAIGDNKSIATNNIDDNISQLEMQINNVSEKMRKSVDAKYDAVDMKLSFKKPQVNGLINNLKASLVSSESGIGQAFNKNTMPQTSAFLKNIQTFTKKINNKNLNKITFGMLEAERKNLNRIMGTTKEPTDLAALSVMKKRFDVFYDNTVEKGLASGSPKILEAIKSARMASSQYKRLFNPQNIRATGIRISDKGGQFTQRVLNGDYTSQQIANFVYGSTKIGGSYRDVGLPVIRKLYDIFPNKSSGRDLIKSGAINRLIENSFKKLGTSGREVFTPELFSKAVKEAMEGNGRDVSKVIFTKLEQQELKKLASLIESQIPRKTFLNVEEGSSAIVEIVNNSLRSIIGIGAFNVANIQGLLAARGVFDSAKIITRRNVAQKQIKEALFAAKLPQSSGGAGLVDQSVENRNFMQNTNRGQVYGNEKIDNAKVLEDLKIIESLNKYR